MRLPHLLDLRGIGLLTGEPGNGKTTTMRHVTASALGPIPASLRDPVHRQGHGHVLILDEAHHLRNGVLEDLRLLANYDMEAGNRLCVREKSWSSSADSCCEKRAGSASETTPDPREKQHRIRGRTSRRRDSRDVMSLIEESGIIGSLCHALSRHRLKMAVQAAVR